MLTSHQDPLNLPAWRKLIYIVLLSICGFLAYGTLAPLLTNYSLEHRTCSRLWLWRSARILHTGLRRRSGDCQGPLRLGKSTLTQQYSWDRLRWNYSLDDVPNDVHGCWQPHLYATRPGHWSTPCLPCFARSLDCWRSLSCVRQGLHMASWSSDDARVCSRQQ